MAAPDAHGRSVVTARAVSRLAWGGVGLSLAMATTCGVLWLLNGSTTVPVDFGTRAAAVILAFASLPFAGVGALIIARRSQNNVGWVCLAIGLLMAGTHLAGEYAAYALLTAPGSLPGGDVAAWLFNWLWVVYIAIGVYLILTFPNGQLLSRKWRVVPWIAGVGTSLGVISFALAPGRLENVRYATNPFGLESAGEGLELVSLGFFVLPVCMLASAVSMIVRFRRSVGDERQQLKWFASAAALTGSAFLGQSIFSLATGIDNPLTVTRVLQDAVVLSFYALPVATGIAILKYRLYEIDVIINRTLVYGGLTVLLVLIYVGGVVGLGEALRSLFGQEDNNLAVAASTLAVAALFRPARARIQSFIDRRFYRSKYDAVQTLEAFGTRLRDEVDLDELTGDLLVVVKDTMQPAHASLWLRASGMSR